MKDISAIADVHYARMWDRLRFEEELDAYLEENGITYEQYRKQREEDQADYAISQREWA